VDDVEDRDGLARFALGVERIAAEIYEIEGDSDDKKDRPRVARLGDVVEPVERRVWTAGLFAGGLRSRLGVGQRDLFRTQKPNP